MENMKTVKIVTLGNPSGFEILSHKEWINRLESEFKQRCDNPIAFTHLPILMNQEIESEKEEILIELSKIKECDIVIVNLANAEHDDSTLIKLGILIGLNICNLNKFTHVVGIGSQLPTNPWLKGVLTHFEESVEDAADYIINYLI